MKHIYQSFITAFIFFLSLQSFADNSNIDTSNLESLKSEIKKIEVPIQIPYTETQVVYDDDESITTVANIDHSKSPSWVLISVDGEKPSKKQIKAYRKKIEKREEDSEKDPFLNILNLDSLQFSKSTEEFDIYTFNPILSAFNEESRFEIDGLIYLDKSGKIQRILINAPKKFSPVFSVSMTTFLIDYTILYQDDTPYISYNEVEVAAKIGGFKKLNIKSNTSISNTQW